MSLDQVVAHNVRRIRKEKGIGVSELANRMGVGRHLIYDFERPRPGAEQRQFSWADIVSLCGHLNVTLPELVFPPETEFVVEIEELTELAPLVAGMARNRLGWVLFGFSEEEDVKTLVSSVKWKKQDEESRLLTLARVLAEHMEQMNEPGYLDWLIEARQRAKEEES